MAKEYYASMDTWLKWQIEDAPENTLPGLQVAIAHHDEVVFEHAYGYADVDNQTPLTLDHQLPAGSITKTLTTIELMRAMEQGLLSPDTKLAEIVDIPSPYDPRVRDITISDLYSHSSGLPANVVSMDADDGYGMIDSDKVLDEQDLVAMMSSIRLKSDPGERLSYSNLGMAMAGLALKQVVGQSVEALIRRNILAPLGMNSSGFDLPIAEERRATTYHRLLSRRIGYQACQFTEQGALSPSTGMISNASDLVKLAPVLMGRRPEILSQTGLEHMRGTLEAFEGATDMRRGIWIRRGDPALFGAWAGTVSRVYMHPDHDTAISVTTNTINPGLIDHLAQGIKRFDDMTDTSVVVDPREGIYAMSDGSRVMQLIMTARGMTRIDPSRLNPLPPNVRPLDILDASRHLFAEPMGDRTELKLPSSRDQSGIIEAEGDRLYPL